MSGGGTTAAQGDASADLEEVLDHLSALVEEARALPMSSSCVVHRGEVLDLVDEARRVLPGELEDARRLLGERDDLLEQARAEADRLVTQAREEHERLLQEAHEEQTRLVEQTAVWSRAQLEADRTLEQASADADRLLAQAEADATAMRLQTEDYVDGKLANFENVLSTTLATVQRGRERLSGRSDLDDLQGDADGPQGGSRDPELADAPPRRR